jgi:hypothetical protein
MLLRRLKDRVVNSQSGKLQCIATSATLGSDQNAFPDVAKFAERLFGECFEWIEDDRNRQDIIRAVRQPISTINSTDWNPDPGIYKHGKVNSTKMEQILIGNSSQSQRLKPDSPKMLLILPSKLQKSGTHINRSYMKYLKEIFI